DGRPRADGTDRAAARRGGVGASPASPPSRAGNCFPPGARRAGPLPAAIHDRDHDRRSGKSLCRPRQLTVRPDQPSILYLLPAVPLVADTGGALRALSVLRALDKAFRLTVVARRHENEKGSVLAGARLERRGH